MFKRQRSCAKNRPAKDLTQQPTSPRSQVLKPLMIGALASAMFAIILVTWAYLDDGRSTAERSATDLAMPIGVMWLMLLLGVVCQMARRRIVATALFVVGWGFVSVLFNPMVAETFQARLQSPVTVDPLSDVDTQLDCVVLLGGYAGKNRLGVPELNSSGQRFLLAAQLWHAGKTKTLICTGTGLESWGNPKETGRVLLVSVGVPDDVIFEVPGDNTAAEMQGLKKFFDEPPARWLELVGATDRNAYAAAGESVGLVTSAMHMPRASRLAAATGLRFRELVSNVRGTPANSFSPRQLIPTASAGKSFAIAFKEWLASLVGR